MQFPSLIHGFQTNSVFGVDWRISQRQDFFGLAWSVILKMLRLLWLHLCVLIVLDHDKVIQLVQVDCIGCILYSLLVVDFSNKLAFFHICIKIKWIMPILSLDKEILDKVNICTIAKKIPDNVTEEEHLPRTKREAKDSLVLSTNSDQVLHRWFRTPLSHCPQELASLRETNSVVTIL
jgi:hypothetical protein